MSIEVRNNVSTLIFLCKFPTFVGLVEQQWLMIHSSNEIKHEDTYRYESMPHV